MRALALIPLLLLCACYQVAEPVVATGARVPGLTEGVYRHSDGSTVTLTWEPALGAYGVGAGGTVRLEALAPGLYLADYQAERRIVLLAQVDGGTVVFRVPADALEHRLAKARGLGLRPGPVKILEGPAPAVHAYFVDLAKAGAELAVAERLEPVRP